MMMFSVGRHASRDIDKELVSAYDGEIPPPYYFWDIGLARRHMPAIHRPGEIEAVLPYPALPAEVLRATAVSIDELDDIIERRARREELSGGN